MSRDDERPVRANDRISDVLARDEALLEVFVRHSPHFAKLRSRTTRRIMARLVTVEQAAHMANVATAGLVGALNAALGFAGGDEALDVEPGSASRVDTGDRHPASARVVELDLREELRAGREPFATIMDAVAALGDDEVLVLRTIFEPVPLFAVLAKRGFLHETIGYGEEDWTAWFWRPADHLRKISEITAVPPRARDVAAPDDGAIWLDVRGLEPPEPLMRTLKALESLQPGQQLVHVNSRVPQLLFPMLAERGFACTVDDAADAGVLVRIWRAH